jgi:hypothetical protein
MLVIRLIANQCLDMSSNLAMQCVFGDRKKQIAVALSTCESEYHAMTMAAKEVLWVRRVLTEAGFDAAGTTIIRSDNQSAISWATSERIPMSRAKHIAVRAHSIRDLVSSGDVSVKYIATTLNDTDMMTKPVGPTVVKEALKRIKLISEKERTNVSSSVEEEC